jgi:hypothetical protein
MLVITFRLSDSMISNTHRLGGRAQDITERDPGALSRLPFSRDTYFRITNEFLVHNSICRVINRNTTAHCSRELDAWGERVPNLIGKIISLFCRLIFNLIRILVYNCRSTASWPGDLALSATYLPNRKFTYGIMYGCTGNITNMVVKRLSNSDMKAFHPLTLPTIFADIERKRHFDIASDYANEFLQRVMDIVNNTTKESTAASLPGRPKTLNSEKLSVSAVDSAVDSTLVKQWLRRIHFRNGLESWQAQLHVLMGHVTELEDAYLTSQGPNDSIYIDEVNQMRRHGVKIKARLQQIANEYDEKIRECNGYIDGMSFTTQVVCKDFFIQRK